MKKITCLLFIFIQLGVFAQKSDRPMFFDKPVFFEINSLPNDSLHDVFISYKVPYNRLVFIKEGNGYTAGIRIGIEIESDKKLIVRDFSERTVVVSDYESTNSKKDFVQGLFDFKLAEGEYLLSPSVTIYNMNGTFNLPPKEFKIESSETNSFLKPIVINDSPIECNNDSNFTLINNGAIVPFQPEPIKILLPVRTNSDSLHVNVIQNDTLILRTVLQQKIGMFNGLGICDNAIIVLTNSSQKYSLFELNNFSHKLQEGNFVIEIESEDSTKKIELDVGWINKPRSLMNPELAIELIELIEDREKVSKLLETKEENYSRVLSEYWAKYDRDKSTAFNEVMNEFYSRVDYANQEFSTVNNPEGVKSDRGKVYLKYGEPDSIQRDYSSDNNILEIWRYEKISKEFVFSDKSGLGNFTLVK